MTSLAIAAAGASDHGSGVSTILIVFVMVLIGAKLAGELVERLGQPAVLGELVVGVVLGNLAIVGGPDLHAVAQNETFAILAELGAVLLLFYVGLESTPAEMMAVGGRATLVATVGVVTPMILGFGVGELFHPDESWMLHAFLGSMLSATSVGITARVLGDLGAVKTAFARIILGAAVIDDVMGLVVLAIVSGIIQGAATGTSLGVGAIAWICAKAILFLAGALVIGGLLSPRLFRYSLALRTKGIVHAFSLSLCFGLAYLAALVGLAPIVGAFAAGLVLEEVHFRGQVERGERPLHETLEPLVAFLVPVFFVRMGMLVDLRSFARTEVLGFAVALTVAAVAGKLVCGLAVPAKVGRTAVGLGMMPRGEVGLIFAAIGARMMLFGKPVVSPSVYAAAVFMVVVTTMATPPSLVWAVRRERKREARAAS